MTCFLFDALYSEIRLSGDGVTLRVFSTLSSEVSDAFSTALVIPITASGLQGLKPSGQVEQSRYTGSRQNR